MRRATLQLMFALLVVAPTAAVADVADYLGKRVVTCRVTAEGQDVAEARVLGLVETRPGSTLSLLTVRESVAHLYSLGRFDDIRVTAGAAGDGVAIVYDVVPVHPIRRILFTGPLRAPGIDDGRLRKEMVDRYGQSPPPGRRLDLARIAEDDLKEHGYLHPVVTPHVEIFHAPDRATLTFAIEPGDRTYVSGIEVAGTPGVPIPQLLDRLKLKAGIPYERDAMAARMQEYQAKQRANGYVKASLTMTPRFEEGDRAVVLTVTAQQGPRVNVVFKGDSIPDAKQEELVPVIAEGSADESLLEDSSLRIEDHLRALGYRDAVAPYMAETIDAELRITYTITRGALYRVTDVIVTGNTFQPTASLEPRFTVRRGQPLSDMAVAADASMIADFYRRQGFAAVRVEPVVVPQETARTEALLPVTVRFDVTEGARTIVTSVRLQGNSSVPESELAPSCAPPPAQPCRDPLGLQPGQPFFLTQMALDRDKLEVKYADRGYQRATITVNPGLSADATRADVVFMINEGRQLMVDHLLIVGNERTSTETIERELEIKPGQPLGTAALIRSQRQLAALGLFRRVRFTQIPHGDENRRDVVVTVEEAPVTSIGYGGGLEGLERAQGTAANSHLVFGPRAFFEVGRRNLFGSNRSVNLFTGVSLRPDELTDRGWRLQDYRVVGTFREPRLFGSTADAYLTGTIEQQTRTTFRVTRHAFSTEVGKRVTEHFSVSGNYQIQRTELFDDQTPIADRLLIDRLFSQVRLSSFSIAGVHSTKDDVVNATTGHYLSANGQLAAKQFGSEVGLFKTYLTAQLFRTLPRARRTVFAGSVRLGMARGFQSVQTDLPASERFFAGGDTTVRGFALDQLGATSTLDANGFAIGGNAVIILNAELRVPVYKAFGVVGFFDAGNVFARATDMDLSQLRGSVGFGLRYRSPVGPVRVDVGFKTRPREIVPGIREKPTAIHISLGQAF